MRFGFSRPSRCVGRSARLPLLPSDEIRGMKRFVSGATLVNVLGLSLSLFATPAWAYDWFQINGDSQHSGNNTLEAIISPSNVVALTFLFRASLPSVEDGAPVYLSAVATASGVRDLLFVTTRAGHIVALDAHSGATIWSQQHSAGSCKINNGSQACFTSSSPAIDPNRLYVYSYGLDGRVHKHQVGDGTEITSGGWPEMATLKGFDDRGSAPLTFATSAGGTTYLYMIMGGYQGDLGDYQGHVTAVNLSDGSQRVFNSVCSDQTVHFVETPGAPDCVGHVQAGIWARAGVVYDGETGRIFLATGNGDYNGNIGGFEWGDSVLSLNPDGTGSGGKPLDAYTPVNFASLQSSDADLGSTAPAILPAPGYSGRLAVQSGKDAKLRLINLKNLSGMGGPGHVGGELQLIDVPQGCVVVSALAVWVNPADSATWVFVSNKCGISGLRLSVTAGVPSLVEQWTNSNGGSSPMIANNVLYQAGGGIIRAMDLLTGNTLWSDTVSVSGNHWESPIVVNGVLYITDESSRVTAYSLPLTAVSITPRWGPTSGGTQTTILGSSFQSGASVSFGAAASPAVTVVNPTTIAAGTPAQAAGTYDVVITNPGGATSTLTSAFTFSGADFFAVTPCRPVDTRNIAGPMGAPSLTGTWNRTFSMAGHCAIPASAKSLALNVTVTQATTSGSLTLYQGSTSLPAGQVISYSAGQTRAANAIVSLDSGGDLIVHCEQSSGTVHLIVDVVGYFQ